MTGQPMLRDAVVEGRLATVRPLDARDADMAFELLSGHREILRWLEWSGPADREQLTPLFERWRRGGPEGCDYYFAIVDRSDSAFAGCIGARFRGHPGCGEVGFWLDPERWGRGLASEALALVAWLCFAHLEAVLLSARVLVGNDASRRVLSRCGFREDHASRTLFDGVPREQWHLSLSRSDYAMSSSVPPVSARIDVTSGSDRASTCED